MSFTDTLTNDLGPLPVWGWGAVGAAGIAGGLWIRRLTDNGSSRRNVESATVVAGDAGATSFQPFGGVGGGSIGFAGGGAVNVTPTTEITTNTQWRQAALDAAIARGYTASVADRILSDYLDGQPLTADMSELLDMILPIVGLPPSPPTITPGDAPAPPDTDTPSVDDPVVAPTPTPGPDTQEQTYTVVEGDTLSALALRFYGNGNLWPVIYDANRDKLDDPDRIFPGQVLTIPRQNNNQQTYTVVEGDTLSELALRFYGNGTEPSWRRIFDANRDKISNPDRIFPGQVLIIP